jgi:multidrug efflux pump subunit AcrA (membrane-fusion protein)
MLGIRITLGLLLITLVGGCLRGGEQDRPNSQETDTAGMLVSVAAVVRAQIRSETKFLGTTVALKQLTVRSPTSGFLSDLTLEPGDQVKQGQLVARVTSREDVAARNGMKVAQQLDPADSHAMAETLRRYVSSPGIAVSAGANGTVSKRLTSNGQFVNEFDPIVELVDAHSIYVEAQAPLNLMSSIRVGQAVAVTSPMSPDPMPATVAGILPNASQDSQTFPIRVTFDSRGPSIPEAGVAVQVWVVTKERPDALVVPATSLFTNPETHVDYVFVFGSDGRAHRRPVTIGIRDPQRVEVLHGLSSGESVITSGGYALSDGLAVRPSAP